MPPSQATTPDEVSENIGVKVGDLAVRDRCGDERPDARAGRLQVGGSFRLDTEGWRVDQRDPPDLVVECGIQVGVDLGDKLVERRLPRVSDSDRTRYRLGVHLRVHGAEQGLLAGEMVVHRAFGDARRVRAIWSTDVSA